MKIVLTLFILLLSMQINAQIQLPDSVVKQRLFQASQYLNGIGVAKDESKAFTIYEQCAALGNAKAMNALGILYKEGIGTTANKTKALAWLTEAGKNGYAQGWYNLGMIYKDATIAVERDYIKAYDCFSKAAAMNDEQSVYAKAYMLYKGLGCAQNYKQAAVLFKQGAISGRPNSMYFLGLCFRNGYGITSNTDSAHYWLSRAYKKGYMMAHEELSSSEPENSNTEAKKVAAELRKNTQFIPANVNQYKRLEQNLPASNIGGIYYGSIIKYDWSGENAINVSGLKLELDISNGNLIGKWTEADTIIVPFKAIPTQQSLIFKNMQYSQKDHYNVSKPAIYDFEKAKLQWNKSGDSVYLSGSIQMFSPSRNEPQKPLFISLVRRVASTNKTALTLYNEDGTPLLLKSNLMVFPNPFTDILQINFKTTLKSEVEIQLLTTEGTIVYRNNGGILDAGNYTIPVRPSHLASGVYIVKLICGNQVQTSKVVKQ